MSCELRKSKLKFRFRNFNGKEVSSEALRAELEEVVKHFEKKFDELALEGNCGGAEGATGSITVKVPCGLKVNGASQSTQELGGTFDISWNLRNGVLEFDAGCAKGTNIDPDDLVESPGGGDTEEPPPVGLDGVEFYEDVSYEAFAKLHIDCRHATVGGTLCGEDTFIATLPPRKYKSYGISTTRNGTCSSGGGVNDSLNWSRVWNPDTCTYTETGSTANACCFGFCADGGESKTATSWTITQGCVDCLADSSCCVGGDLFSGTYIQTRSLGNEDTDSDAIERAHPEGPPWSAWEETNYTDENNDGCNAAVCCATAYPIREAGNYTVSKSVAQVRIRAEAVTAPISFGVVLQFTASNGVDPSYVYSSEEYIVTATSSGQILETIDVPVEMGLTIWLSGVEFVGT